MRLLFSVVLAGAVLAFAAPPPVASAQGDNPLIEQGAQMVDELRYEEALQTLSAALVRPGNSRAELATIYRLLALTYLALGRNEEANGAYRHLLAIEPEFQLGADVSPRFREFFSGVREEWEREGRPGMPPPAPVTIRHASPAQAERGRAVELRAGIEDPSGRVARLVLAYRQGSSDVFQRLDTTEDGDELVATIPGEHVRPPLVEYYFEALDAAGLPVASRGDVAAPLRIAVPAPGEGSIFTKWWFWVGAAVIVAGGVTAAVLLTQGDAEPQGTLIINVR